MALVDVPDNITIVDPCVSYSYIEAESSETSQDTCVIDVNRVVPIEETEIVWQITYEIAGSEQTGQQMSSTMVSLEPIHVAGDITAEGIVDFEDLAILVEQWLGAPGVPSADIAPIPAGDGVIDFRDFAILAENWLK